MTGLLRGSMQGSVLVVSLWKSWIDTLKHCFRKEVWMSDKQGEWCMIGMYSGEMCRDTSRE